MPRTLNLTGFQAGDNLNLSVSQGALTAGPVNAPSWGGFASGGTISIVVPYRTPLNIAPDSVPFEVDLSQSTFDTPAPDPADIYDERLHEFVYIWDFDDGANRWDKPEHYLPHWLNSNVGHGPAVRKMYYDAGSYSPSVWVLEKSSGKVATATIATPIVVNPMTDYYGDDDMVFIRPSADSDDTSYIPAGVPAANRHATDSLYAAYQQTPDATWSRYKLGGAGDTGQGLHFRFKRGGTYDVNLWFNNQVRGPAMVSDYGDPNAPAPILRHHYPDAATYKVMFRVDGLQFTNGDPTAPGMLRLLNLDLRGNFDATTMHGQGDYEEATQLGIWAADEWCILVGNCTWNGFGSSVMNLDVGGGSGQTRNGVGVHVDNTAIENSGGQYPFIWTTSPGIDGFFAITGFRGEQPGDGISRDEQNIDASNALFRLNHCRRIYIECCDLFMNGDVHGLMNIAKSVQEDGCIINAYGIAGEGGSAFSSMHGNVTAASQLQRSAVQNMIFDNIIYQAQWNTGYFLKTHDSGFTLRNFLVYTANQQKLSETLLAVFDTEGYDSVDAVPQYVKDAPIRVYSGTFRTDRDHGQNTQHSTAVTVMPLRVTGADIFTNVSVENVVIHAPNLDEASTPITTYAPVSDAELWSPRSLGRGTVPHRDNVNPTVTFDPSWAAPNGPLKTQPTTGSSAIAGVASGKVAYKDLSDSVRPAPASIGAWED